MYFSIFPSSEYYSDEEESDEEDDNADKDNVCIICLRYSNKNSNLNLLNDISYVYRNCKCNPIIHNICFYKWIKQSSTCPICRTSMYITLIPSNNVTNNTLLNYYIICVRYAIHMMKIICYLSFLNTWCLLCYNVYVIYIHSNDYIENSEIY